jgi:chromosome segregation ATPase
VDADVKLENSDDAAKATPQVPPVHVTSSKNEDDDDVTLSEILAQIRVKGKRPFNPSKDDEDESLSTGNFRRIRRGPRGSTGDNEDATDQGVPHEHTVTSHDVQGETQNEENTILQDLIPRLNRDIQREQFEKQMLHEKMEELKKTNEEDMVLQAETSRLKEEIRVLQAQLSRLQEENTGLQAQLSRLQENKMVLQAETSRLTEKNRILQAETSRLQEEDMVLQAETSRLKEKDRILQAQTSRLQERNMDLQAQISRLNKDLQKEVKANGEGQVEIQGLKEEIENIKNEKQMIVQLDESQFGKITDLISQTLLGSNVAS